jgi:cyclic pyranopterin phosphate synthase
MLHAEELSDAQGRRIAYLRLSLTDRCNFRCNYCSASDHEIAEGLLTRAEIRRIIGVLARMGIRRVRLTGGEPTLRKDLVAIAAEIKQTPGIDEVALSTNGHRLADLAEPLRAAGVESLNVSLDTLRDDRLFAVSGRGARLLDVVSGIDAAATAGFPHLKTNTVVMGGVNEDELGDIVRFSWERGATPRFIELMPFGEGKPVSLDRVKALLAEQGLALEPDPFRGWGPAHYLHGRAANGTVRRVGFIGAMTHNFCDACNRARITATGEFQACLGGQSRVSLRDLVRAGGDDAELERAVHAALAAKAPRHHMEEVGPGLVLLPMRGIGG